METHRSCHACSCLLDPHRHALHRRHEAALRMVRDGHKRITLRVVGGEAALGDVVTTHNEAADMAADAVLDCRGEPDNLPFFQALTCDIRRIHEQHHARAKDAAEPVAIRIDGRIELAWLRMVVSWKTPTSPGGVSTVQARLLGTMKLALPVFVFHSRCFAASGRPPYGTTRQTVTFPVL